jgi:hypothetical protein
MLSIVPKGTQACDTGARLFGAAPARRRVAAKAARSLPFY